MTRRWRRAGGAVVALAGLALLANALFPPDLTRWQARSAVLLARDGSMLHVATTRDGLWRLGTEARSVDPHYIEMLLAAEDRRFYDHAGIDPWALGRAAGQMLRNGRIISGGSTLTMQVARLLEPHRRSWLGKLHDLVRAAQLEARYGKADILAMYLTLAPFGGNIEGVRAASLAWFGHEPDRLTPGESAILVALPQRPAALRPDRHPDAALAAATHVLRRLTEAQRIPPEDLETPPPAIAGRHRFPRDASHVATRFGASGGVTLSTLDAPLQRAVQELAARDMAWSGDGGDLAILVVDNRDLSIRAWLGGTASALDLVRRRRSPGSTLKPFIYGLAFDDLAILPDTLIEDRAMRFGDYAPENFDHGFHGNVTARAALQQSLNVPAIALLDRVGPGRLAAVLRAAGARLQFPAGNQAPTLPLALGGVGISLLDLTRLYAGLARDGAVLPLHVTPPTQSGPAADLMTVHAARLITDILRGSPPPDGRMPSELARDGRPIAYKTGTSYGFRDAWAVGYSPSWTIGIWTGRADGTPRPAHYGRNTAAPLLFSVFDLLPPESEADRLAPGLVTAEPGPLPVALRQFAGRDAAQALPGAVRPRISYPPDGAVLDLSRADGSLGPLALEAEGGAPPYRWSVNGWPIRPPDLHAPAFWQPDGQGYARVTVLDSAGRRASVNVRLQ